MKLDRQRLSRHRRLIDLDLTFIDITISRNCGSRCELDQTWYRGRTLIFSVVLIDGTPQRFGEGL